MREASNHLARGRALRAGFVALWFAVGSALAGCAGGSGAPGAFAMAGEPSTVAFESIDGPPPKVFDRMVSVLNSETKLRNVAVVSRESAAAYRVRSYLAAQVIRGHTVIAWVWDVYDRDQQRALRLAGQEVAGKAARDPWSAADDLVLRKIAQAGLTGVAGMVNGSPETIPLAPPQGKGAAAVAKLEAPTSSSLGAFAYANH